MPNNFAFIDGQNLHLGITELGWKLGLRRFRIYLKDHYSVSRAYYFVGYVPENQGLYTGLQNAGYVLVFKQVTYRIDGKPKGNVDAELVLQAMIEYPNYDRAVIVTSDGDFACLVRHLYDHQKLERVLSPDVQHCSALLKQAARDRIDFLTGARKKIEYRSEGAPRQDQP
jgi:uncharacterized LabA/DUF88 family protein